MSSTKELYEYMKEKRAEMMERQDDGVRIDMQHFFRIYQMMCFFMQIRNIVNFDEDMAEMLKMIK